MASYSGVTWRVNYGEINERNQFRVGYVGLETYAAYFPVAQLADLIAVLNAVIPLGLNTVSRGTAVQARKVANGLVTYVVIEPRLDTGTPVETMRLPLTELSDLLYALGLFQVAVAPSPDDWDISRPLDVLTGTSAAKSVGDPTTLLGAALMNNRAPSVPANNKLVAWGSSIVGTTNNTIFQDSIQSYASAYSGGKLDLIGQAGFPGATSSIILAQFDQYVRPFSPGIVLVNARTNDRSGGGGAAISLDQSKANHLEMIRLIHSIGAEPIMMSTLPVTGASVDEKLENSLFDNWLRQVCGRAGIVFVEAWAAVVSNTANAWPDNNWTNDGGTNAADGIHPDHLATRAVGQAIANALPANWPKGLKQAFNGVDPSNLLLNPTMAAGTTLANNWVEFNGPNAASRAYSLVTDPLVPGRMQRITINESGNQFAQLRQEVNTTSPDFYTAGDVLGVYAVVTIEDTVKVAGRNLRLEMKIVEGGGPPFQDHIVQTFVGIRPGRTSGVDKHERIVLGKRFVAREGIFVTSVQFVLQAGTLAGASGSNLGGQGYAQFGAVRLVNLTRMGLA